MVTNDSQHTIYNPYVGPRAFDTVDHDNFFGRDAEIRQLADLVVAQRVVLLYAPSGAGKTSLINAGLIPALKALERRRMTVLPVARVGGSAPADVANPFVFNVLSSMPGETLEPEKLQKGLEALSSLTAKEVPEGEPVPTLLILDQFEELFTLHPASSMERTEFFAQLQALLDTHPTWGLLLAMREEYIAYLDSYAAMLPDRLRTRFRLELLNEDAARLAIQIPARKRGVDFSDTAADRLVDDLRRVQEQGLDGLPTSRVGRYVEPVQLQVVCRQVWERVMGAAAEKHAEGPISISESDLTAVGDVDTALATYYAQTMTRIAEETDIPERAIRDWCTQQLITPQGLRGIVQHGAGESSGLDNSAITSMVDAHLVRAEQRAGAVWYELAHDRLVEPVRRDNAAWFERNLSLLQRQAALWEEQKRPAGLLLSGDELTEAENWAEGHPTELTDAERDFMADCRAARAQMQRERMQNRRIRWMAGGMAIAFVLALILAFFAWEQTQQTKAERTRAEQQRNIALARQWTAMGQLELEHPPKGPTLGTALGIESMRINPSWEGDQLLRRSLSRLPHQITRVQHNGRTTTVSFSSNGQWIASGSWDGTARVWEAATGAEVTRLQHDSWVNAVAFSPTGRWVVSGSWDGTARVWEVKTGAEIARMQHDSKVTAVTFSHGGLRVASGDESGIVRIWDAVTGTEVTHMQHDDRVKALTFSPSGKWIASGSWDGTARVWNATTGIEVARMQHNSEVVTVAFSPDGQWVVSGSYDKTARVWETTTGTEVARVNHNNAVTTVNFSPDGQRVVSGSYDKTARVWEAATGTEVASVQHDDIVTAVAFSPDGKWVISGSRDSTGQIWDATTGIEVTRIPCDSWVQTVAFSPDGQRIVNGNQSGIVQVWDVSTSLDTNAVTGGEMTHMQHKNSVSKIVFSPDGRWVVSGSMDGTAQVWETTTGIGIARMQHDRSVSTVAFSPDGRWVASGSRDNTVQVWKAETGAEIAHMQHEDDVTALAFSPDGQWIISGSQDNTARVWKAATGVEIARLQHNDIMTVVAFSPDGLRVLSGDRSGVVWVWEAATGAKVAHVQHDGWINAAIFSPDGQWVVSGSQDGTVCVWEAETGTEIVHLQRDGNINTVDFSPDGRWIVSGEGFTARVWEATTGKEITHVKHDSWVEAATFSPDGQWIVSGSSDSTVRVWKAATGEEVARMHHNTGVTTVAFSSDGRWVASGSHDGSARVWPWRSEDLITEACARLPRNLTREEWEHYMGDEPYRATCPNLPFPEE